jgi:1-acyl-sn-glycerol-3-phosphate acyltransferase
MLEARQNLFVVAFFRWYTRLKLKRNFHKVQIKSTFQEKNLPVLVLSNHVSWWDGFWVNYLNQQVFRRKFYFMMLEEQLRKFSFFRNTGGFSVKKGSRSAVESLRYASKLLSDKQNMVLMFPQGEIRSMHQQEIVFEKGLEIILKMTENPVQIVFVANLTDYFSQAKPLLRIYAEEYTGSEFDLAGIQSAYQLFYHRCLAENLKIKPE